MRGVAARFIKIRIHVPGVGHGSLRRALAQMLAYPKALGRTWHRAWLSKITSCQSQHPRCPPLAVTSSGLAAAVCADGRKATRAPTYQNRHLFFLAARGRHASQRPAWARATPKRTQESKTAETLR